MKKEEIVNNLMVKMDLRSMNVGLDNRARLKALFPSVFTETQNERGEPIEVVDFEKLKPGIPESLAIAQTGKATRYLL